MTRRIAIVPYGVGIGDLVNMRPIAEVLVRNFLGSEISMVVPQNLDWMLPKGVTRVGNVRGLQAWQRLTPSHPVARLSATFTVGSAAPLVRAIPVSRLASMVTRELNEQGFDLIFNLLAYFSTLNLDARWTVGAWTGNREHVIDLLFSHLQENGIFTDSADRTPRLFLDRTSHGICPAIILNPTAGSTLKEAPVELWIEIARSLQDRGMSPLILSAPRRNLAQSICDAVPGSVLLANESLEQVAAWIAGADLLVSPDTGVLHIASALDIRYVGLFGSTDPQFLGPYNRNRGVILETPLEHEPVCKACWTAQILPTGRCPLYPPPSCVGGIEAERVLAAIDDHLQCFDRGSVNRAQ